MAGYISHRIQNEEARLNALRDLNLLDTSPSESFDRLTRLASRLLDAPVSTISLTDHDRQWFKSKVGMELAQIPRAQAPCSYAIEADEVFVVPDLLEDARFKDSPLAQAGIRFYAGAPLFTRQGHGLGTLCVVDARARDLGSDERQLLRDLAGMVMSQVDLHNMIGRLDATTGIANQHQMLEDIEEMARRNPGEMGTGILLDIISSQQIGQGQRVLGAAFVEALMRSSIERLRPHLGNTAKLYHVGATRCAVLLSPQFGGDVDGLALTLCRAVRDPIECGGIPVEPTPVLGTCTFLCGEITPGDVLRRLFNAVEDAFATETGRAHYSPVQDLKHARSFMLLNDFKSALMATDQLSLSYQPRIDMRSGQSRGVEALLRWKHPALGSIAPAEFIPAVEQTALARFLTDWVVDTALRQAKNWGERGIDLKISINVSARNLDESDFTERLLAAIRDAGVPPSRIELEFTESALARDGSGVAEQLQLLRQFGVEIAIDDFGSGYSNLSYLHQLPASVLKIDRAFVIGLENSPRDQTLVRTIIEMAHHLGYRVVAEGIETQAAYDLLKGWGCDEGQGYLMAKPMPSTRIGEWMSCSGDALKVA